jgi:hypothetical protein
LPWKIAVKGCPKRACGVCLDAYLAALAREHGLIVVSSDSDFGKFRGVAWLNPATGEERRSSS